MLSDTLTIGLVLVLLFGSIALYLYTCIQQSEQKVSLLESILLDLKMSAEVKSYTELPMDTERHVDTDRSDGLASSNSTASSPSNASQASQASQSNDTVKEESYVPFEEEDAETLPAEEVIDIGDYKSAIAEAVEEQSSSPNYEAMSLKELQSLAKSRNIVGVTKKGPLIEALKTSDRSSTVKPSAMNAVGSNSFLETSAPVSDETA
jgi:hypothetical protein